MPFDKNNYVARLLTDIIGFGVTRAATVKMYRAVAKSLRVVYGLTPVQACAPEQDQPVLYCPSVYQGAMRQEQYIRESSWA
jgi:hypothetical protein